MSTVTTTAPERSVEERNALIEQWSGLVPWVLRRLWHVATVRRHADDCRSVAYLALVRAADRWREDAGAAFKTFAVGSIRWAIIHEVRRIERRRERPYPGDGFEPTDPVGEDEGPDREELAAAIAPALATLTPRQRQILTLHFGLDGGPYRKQKEVGRLLGCAPQNVAALREKALLRLAASLAHLATPRTTRGM